MKKLKLLIKNLLQEGLSAKKMAIAMSVGSVIGFFPILGTTTIISGFVAVRFRLNMVAVQLVNYLVYPLQLLLIIPEIKLAHALLYPSAKLGNVRQFLDSAQDFNFAFVEQFGHYILLSLIGWLMISIPAAFGLYFFWYFIAKFIFVKFKINTELVKAD